MERRLLSRTRPVQCPWLDDVSYGLVHRAVVRTISGRLAYLFALMVGLVSETIYDLNLVVPMLEVDEMVLAAKKPSPERFEHSRSKTNRFAG